MNNTPTKPPQGASDGLNSGTDPKNSKSLPVVPEYMVAFNYAWEAGYAAGVKHGAFNALQKPKKLRKAKV